MQAFIVRRLLQSVVVLLGIITLVFFLMRLAGDPAVIMMPAEASEEQIEAYRKAMGLDRPLLVQYWTYLANVVRGDFGMSLRFRQPAMALVLERLPATIQLAFGALAVGMFVGIPMGMVSALRRNTIVDSFFKSFALLGQSMPGFWLGIMLILVFAVKLGVLPSSGYGELKYLILPAISLGGGRMALFTRMTRSSLLEVLGQDYMRTARAKGLAEWVVIARHGLKNALVPIITVIGMELTFLLSGSIITESIFAWPGVGRLAIQSISYRDYPIVLATVFMTGCIFVVGNLLVDISYSLLDPRVRLK